MISAAKILEPQGEQRWVCDGQLQMGGFSDAISSSTLEAGSGGTAVGVAGIGEGGGGVAAADGGEKTLDQGLRSFLDWVVGVVGRRRASGAARQVGQRRRWREAKRGAREGLTVQLRQVGVAQCQQGETKSRAQMEDLGRGRVKGGYRLGPLQGACRDSGSLEQWRVEVMREARYWRRVERSWRQVRERAWRVFRSMEWVIWMIILRFM